MTLVARTVGDPTNVIGSLREGIRRMDADLPVYGVRTMEQIIQRLVIKRCVTLGAMGVGVGLVLSVAVGLVLQSQLYGVSGVDPLTFIAVSALLLAVSAAAGYLPARSATKVDPLVALRYE